MPEVKDEQTTGLTLLHVHVRATDLPLPALRARAPGLPQPLQRAADAVTETEPTFRDDLLGDDAASSTC